MKGYQLKITIKGSKPPIWRRVVVPEQFTFCQLHQAIQGAFGWCDYHLHKFEFKKPGLLIRETWEEDDLAESRGCDVLEEGTQIGTLITENPRFIYTYDFGDTWEHQILMEKEVEYEYSYPQVLKYKGDNIPEDCGGIGSYYDLLDKLDDPEAEDHDLMEEWACQQGMGEYDLDEVNANLKAHPAFGQGRAENGQEDAVREPAVQEHAAGKQKTGIQDAEKPETQKPAPRVIHTLEELFSRFDKTELLRIAKVHHIGGCDELGKNKLAPALAAALLDSQRMGRFFGTLSDETTAEFEKAAAAGGIEYQGDLEALSFLHYGGYCGFTSLGTAVVPADVAKAYDEMNTEKCQSDRHYRSQVWACCKAAVYLYGVADAGQVETICRAVGCEADAGEITRLCREMKGVWTDFAYWDGRFIDWDLIQADAYKDVLNYQKGKEFYIPSAPQVKEIARTGAVELKKHIRPLKAFFLAMVGCDEETAREAASSIHHHVRLGTTPKAVEDIMEHFGLNLDSQEKMNGFDEIMEQVWKETRTVGNCGYNRVELDAKTARIDPDAPCPCGSGKRYRQCCGRK
ncbi:SEC-C domain-containing protein [Enterocloster clostridioformis]|uniref:IS1096 element passenger TnpR family protein n=1 Tax=Enterocloster clostridioformis TaxID=1531 RepID=UPI001F396242|nr:SEC-C metal-binding domain-containing protein [Enterocloster clostridioformis]MCF2703094.1 SEC-C domain-containing protein [Enterocloster clostridioformis]